MKYGLIAHGAEVDIRSFSLVRAHFDGISSKDVSRNSIFSHHFLLHVFQGSPSNKSYGVLGMGNSSCRSSFGSNYPYYLCDHLATRRCWFEGPLPGLEGLLLAGGRGHTVGSNGSFIVHAFLAFHD